MALSPTRLAQIRTLISAGDLAGARTQLERALRQDPRDGAACNALSIALSSLNELPQALYYAERAASLLPDDFACHVTLGNLRRASGKFALAADSYARALQLNPRSANAMLGMSTILGAEDKPTSALEWVERGLSVEPNHRELLYARSLYLLQSARARDALDSARQAALSLGSRAPDARVLKQIAFTMNYVPGMRGEEVRLAHERAAEAIRLSTANPIPRQAQQHEPQSLRSATPSSPAPGERLRLGFVSADFHQHSVMFFLDAVYEHLDRHTWHVASYHTGRRSDAVTERFRARSDAWRDAAGQSDDALAALIRDDSVDILVDLSGHTRDDRLGVFARRPAPIQVTYCGYASTTGLREFDARLVDAHTDPPGNDAFAGERLLRLERCFLCFSLPLLTFASGGKLPERDALLGVSPVDRCAGWGEARARLGDGPVFGSFNAVAKLSDDVIRVWSRLLHETPGSVLYLKANHLGDPALRSSLLARFTNHNVPQHRICMEDATPSLVDHLARYHHVNVALDPFPYNGTTTTCEALAMGVPVVTLAGELHAGRVGVSLLNACSCSELVASTEDEYIRIARDLALSPPQRADLSLKILQTLPRSPLCDAPGFVARFSRALLSLREHPAAPNPVSPGPDRQPDGSTS
ncbi:MAG: hypothetical protein SFZ23_15635 [Planctomycetota bacterium]|nr:hypothetical protein [Planctomycetota bacterium]